MTEKLIDPDCRDGKCGSCVGGPCEHDCHAGGVAITEAVKRPDRFTDHRGVIQDLLEGPIDAVTEIRTVRGAVRGNHVHEHTIQWTYVVRGVLLVAHAPVVVHQRISSEEVKVTAGGSTIRSYGNGDLFMDPPGQAHAWKATEDTTVLVITRGPRSGASYEDDVVRLTSPMLVPDVS